jgi:hypothetical protein
MQSLEREILHSLPIDVVFAGFKGNTLSLARAGWDLSMRQQSNLWGAYEMQLVMRHDGARLYALSSPIELEYGRLGSCLNDPVRYAELLSQLHFSIACIAPQIEFHVMPVRGNMFASEFKAIDPFPQERTEKISVKDFKFFKVANPSIKDIIVSPDQVPELLDMVLKAQKETISKVKARERSRENMHAYRDVKPAHQVQAQLITLAGVA